MLRDRYLFVYCLIPLIISWVEQTKKKTIDKCSMFLCYTIIFRSRYMFTVEYINQDEMSLARRSSYSKICRSDYTMRNISDEVWTCVHFMWISATWLAEKKHISLNRSDQISNKKEKRDEKREERREKGEFLSIDQRDVSIRSVCLCPCFLFSFVVSNSLLDISDVKKRTMSKHVCLIGFLLLVLIVVPILSTKSGKENVSFLFQHFRFIFFFFFQVFHLLKQTKQRVKHVVRKSNWIEDFLKIFLSFRMCSTIEIFRWFVLHLHENVTSSVMGRSI